MFDNSDAYPFSGSLDNTHGALSIVPGTSYKLLLIQLLVKVKKQKNLPWGEDTMIYCGGVAI